MATEPRSQVWRLRILPILVAHLVATIHLLCWVSRILLGGLFSFEPLSADEERIAKIVDSIFLVTQLPSLVMPVGLELIALLISAIMGFFLGLSVVLLAGKKNTRFQMARIVWWLSATAIAADIFCILLFASLGNPLDALLGIPLLLLWLQVITIPVSLVLSVPVLMFMENNRSVDDG